MANCFGDVVDNYKLDEMARYVGKTKTREDRAREAMNLINEDSKNEKASKYVKGVKQWYGNGQSTLCLVYNATGDTLTYITDNDWYGYIGRTPYPTEIANGQWAAFHHIKKTSASSGSQAAVVYRGKDRYGNARDFLIAWSTPWSNLSKNKAYCEIGSPGSFSRIWDEIYKKINNSSYSSSAKNSTCEIQADTATGDSPTFKAMILIPYSP